MRSSSSPTSACARVGASGYTSASAGLIGAPRVVLQVFPPKAEHVNLHPYCLHLWERLSGPRLVPDLRLTESDTYPHGVRLALGTKSI